MNELAAIMATLMAVATLLVFASPFGTPLPPQTPADERAIAVAR